MSVLEALHAELEQAGGLPLASDYDRSRSAPAAVVASGPRAARAPGEYELVVETIYEGYLLHYGRARLVRTVDPDLALLAGDRLYALGLQRLVGLSDIPAVSELADVIELTALAMLHQQPELAEAVWVCGARAVGWGLSAEHLDAKRLLRDGHTRASDAFAAVGSAPLAG